MTLQQAVVKATRKDLLGAGGLATLAGIGAITILYLVYRVVTAPTPKS